MKIYFIYITAFLTFSVLSIGCGDDVIDYNPIENPDPNPDPPKDSTTLDEGPIDFTKLKDTYAEIASPTMSNQWAHYNVHDPSYLVDDKFTYCYNTDVAFGNDIKPGIQIRRSINLVEWEFVGWAFSALPSLGSNFIKQNGGEPFNSLWAPYIMKVGNEYRLYYSLSSAKPRLSVIGLATSTSPKGPFKEKGLVVTSLDNNARQTNAIDPTVIVSKDGSHFMFYGSAWDGIYKLEINPATGLAMRNEDKGVRVAQRGFTNGIVNGNIEGPEIIYNADFDKYYLFISYDWLETKYNVRVGRSDNINGPYLDMNGNDMNKEADDYPMLIAPYKFNNHSGWQGVSHPGVFKKGNDYFIGHQGRPGINKYFMVMHTRQIFWTEDGWPIVSSQRFANEEETSITSEEIAGEYEIIDFDYKVVPGYSVEQNSPDFILSENINLNADGSITGTLNGNWTYNFPWMNLSINGNNVKVRLERGRDWENDKSSTILFTGLNNEKLALWGKKIN